MNGIESRGDRMLRIIEDIEKLDPDELVALEEHIKGRMVEERIVVTNRVVPKFRKPFEVTGDVDYGYPYVARLTDVVDGKLTRDFVKFDCTFGGRKMRDVTVSGEFDVSPGEIIEIQTGGSRNRKYRAAYLIGDYGEMILVASWRDSRAYSRIKRYLKGKLALGELVPQVSEPIADSLGFLP